MMNGKAHFTFLRDNLADLLAELPLAVRQRVQFLHDGVPPNIHHKVPSTEPRSLGFNSLNLYL